MHQLLPTSESDDNENQSTSQLDGTNDNYVPDTPSQLQTVAKRKAGKLLSDEEGEFQVIYGMFLIY